MHSPEYISLILSVAKSLGEGILRCQRLPVEHAEGPHILYYEFSAAKPVGIPYHPALLAFQKTLRIRGHAHTCIASDGQSFEDDQRV